MLMTNIIETKKEKNNKLNLSEWNSDKRIVELLWK